MPDLIEKNKNRIAPQKTQNKHTISFKPTPPACGQTGLLNFAANNKTANISGIPANLHESI